MSKQAFKRLRRTLGLPINRDPLPSFSWPGAYPVYYIFADGGVICAECVNRNIAQIDEANSHGGWAVDACDVNHEDISLVCDHCHQDIACAYIDETEREHFRRCERAGLVRETPPGIVADKLSDMGEE